MFSQTILIGHVGGDPRITVVSDERKLASFSLATKRVWYKQGEKQEETTWHRINVVNSRAAEVVEKYVQKGNVLTVSGRIQRRTYEKDGEEKESFEICVDFDGKITLMPRSMNSKNSSGEEGGKRDAGNPVEPDPDFDDDIPF